MTKNFGREVEVGIILRQKGLKLATAESCTGGLVGHRLTNIPGSSEFFLGGIIAYANEVKIAMLDVPFEILQQYGAVSRETVQSMAIGARKKIGADIAISISGIAGPGGAMPGKPVGTTWIGLCANDGVWAHGFAFTGDREANKSSAADAAFQFLLDYLSGDLNLDTSLYNNGVPEGGTY